MMKLLIWFVPLLIALALSLMTFSAKGGFENGRWNNVIECHQTRGFIVYCLKNYLQFGPSHVGKSYSGAFRSHNNRLILAHVFVAIFFSWIWPFLVSRLFFRDRRATGFIVGLFSALLFLIPDYRLGTSMLYQPDLNGIIFYLIPVPGLLYLPIAGFYHWRAKRA